LKRDKTSSSDVPASEVKMHVSICRSQSKSEFSKLNPTET
jgi:hypothetical protein